MENRTYATGLPPRLGAPSLTAPGYPGAWAVMAGLSLVALLYVPYARACREMQREAPESACVK